MERSKTIFGVIHIVENLLNGNHWMFPSKNDETFVYDENTHDYFDEDRYEGAIVRLELIFPLKSEVHALTNQILRLEQT
jgi:hypothetical protein